MTKRKSFKFNLKNEYKKGWDYIKNSKSFIFSIIGLFLFFGIMGFVLKTPEVLLDEIKKYLSEILKLTQDMSQIELIGFIFWNNLKVGFAGLFFGVLAGVVPFLFVLTNGYIIGIVSRMAVNEGGFGVLWRLLPHGVFELPAIFLSLGLGIKLGTFICKKDVGNSFKDYFKNSLRVFFLFILPLLFLASIIEGSFITLSR
jgi:stage II sporulation protein M